MDAGWSSFCSILLLFMPLGKVTKLIRPLWIFQYIPIIVFNSESFFLRTYFKTQFLTAELITIACYDDVLPTWFKKCEKA